MLKTIKETKCTCNACGNIWFFGKQEALENAANAMGNLGKNMMCCTGCLPALLIPNKNVMDLGKCPKCGSRAIKSEEITHEVDQLIQQENTKNTTEEKKKRSNLKTFGIIAVSLLALILICSICKTPEEKSPKEILAEQRANSPEMQAKIEKDKLIAAGYCGDTIEALDLAEKYIVKYCHIHLKYDTILGNISHYDWRECQPYLYDNQDTCDLDCQYGYMDNQQNNMERGPDHVYGCCLMHIRHNNKFQLIQVWRGNKLEAKAPSDFKMVYEDEKFFNDIEKADKAQKK